MPAAIPSSGGRCSDTGWIQALRIAADLLTIPPFSASVHFLLNVPSSSFAPHSFINSELERDEEDEIGSYSCCGDRNDGAGWRADPARLGGDRDGEPHGERDGDQEL